MRFSFLSLIVCGLLLTQGCATAPQKGERQVKTYRPLQVSPTLKFQDIPAPYGFKLIQGESYVFENDFVRFGLLRYVGRARAEQVVSFYREQMPMFGWNEVNVVEYEKSLLNFEKQDQTSIVTVESSKLNTSITIAIAPKSTTSLSNSRKGER